MQLHDAYSVLGIRVWAPEAEVRAAYNARMADPQAGMAAEMIRQAGFPAGPPPSAYAPQQPYGQQPYPPSPGSPYPGPPQQPYGQQPYPPPAQPYGQQPYPPQGAQAYPPPQGGQPYPPPPQGGQAYPFPLSPAQQMAPQPVITTNKVGGKQLAIGGALLLLGIIVTAGTHSAAVHNGGGTYMIAYGPMIIGVITIFKGIFNLSMGK